MTYKSVFKNSKLRMAALFSAAFFLQIQSFAADHSLPVQQNNIEAEKLFLEKKRVKAIKLLLHSSKNSQGSVYTKESHRLAARFSKMFFQNKTQQYFESGEALLYSNPTQAVEFYKKGMEIEPDNMQLMLGWARANISLNKCSLVENLAVEKPWILMVEPEFREIVISVSVCEKDQANFEKYISRWPELLNGKKHLLLTVYQLELGIIKESSSRVDSFKQDLVDADNPGILYWRWKLGIESENGVNDFGQRYVSVCMRDLAKVRQKHKNAIILCNKVAEVQKSIRSSKKEIGL